KQATDSKRFIGMFKSSARASHLKTFPLPSQSGATHPFLFMRWVLPSPGMDSRSACDATWQRRRGTSVTGKRDGWRCLLLSAVRALALAQRGRAAHPESAASGRHGIAATVHPLATEAAVQAMTQGGNAIDAVVAAALTLGVVDGHNSGLGGGCFFFLRLARGTVVALDGRERA